MAKDQECTVMNSQVWDQKVSMDKSLAWAKVNSADQAWVLKWDQVNLVDPAMTMDKENPADLVWNLVWDLAWDPVARENSEAQEWVKVKWEVLEWALVVNMVKNLVWDQEVSMEMNLVWVKANLVVQKWDQEANMVKSQAWVKVSLTDQEDNMEKNLEWAKENLVALEVITAKTSQAWEWAPVRWVAQECMVKINLRWVTDLTMAMSLVWDLAEDLASSSQEWVKVSMEALEWVKKADSVVNLVWAQRVDLVRDLAWAKENMEAQAWVDEVKKKQRHHQLLSSLANLRCLLTQMATKELQLDMKKPRYLWDTRSNQVAKWLKKSNHTLERDLKSLCRKNQE